MKHEIFECNSIQYIIKIGQDKQDNFDIIDSSNQTDIWFHIKDIPSCHVVLQTDVNIKDIPRQVVKRCAYLCKINSKAKKLRHCKVSYTSINNVKKTNIIGQVLIKTYKTVYV